MKRCSTAPRLANQHFVIDGTSDAEGVSMATGQQGGMMMRKIVEEVSGEGLEK